MKVIRNRFIPVKGFRAMNLFGSLFVRGDAPLSAEILNHERIHTAQMREMLYIPFYLWYVVEWIVRLGCKGNAYRNISFEREAYAHMHELNYLRERRRFSFVRYL